MSPRVSVLIPCYNSAAFVAQTLESVLAQTWSNLEIIVVDDGSTDGSRDIMSEFEERGVRIIPGARGGASAARNRAFAASSGDFIQFLDADDIIDSEKISLQMARIGQRDDWIASSEWGRFRVDPRETQFNEEPTWRDLAPIEWLVESWTTGFGMLFPARWLAPRSVLETAGPWNEDLTVGDDGEYFTRVLLASRYVAFCKGARCHYRSGVPGSLSGIKDWKSAFATLNLNEIHVLNHENSERTRRGLSQCWQLFAHAAYPDAPDLVETALSRALALHPVIVTPDGGRVFKWLTRTIGWKAARHLQVVLRGAWT